MSLGCQLVMEHLNLLGATKNKDSSLKKLRVGEANKRVARLIGKVHLLHKARLSSLGEMAVLSSAHKTTQRVKETEEMGICSEQKNKTNI